MLVLNLTDKNWAGFIQSGLTSHVTGEFYVPSASYVGTTVAKDAVGIWVGIGGVSVDPLWQAGVAVNVSYNNIETVTPWYEAYPSNPVYSNSMHFNPGDLVQVWTNYSNGASTFEIKDYSTGQSWGKSISFTRNTSTGEWVAESIGYTLPNFTDITWTSSSSNTGNLISSIQARAQAISGVTEMYCGFITEPTQFTVEHVG